MRSNVKYIISILARFGGLVFEKIYICKNWNYGMNFRKRNFPQKIAIVIYQLYITALYKNLPTLFFQLNPQPQIWQDIFLRKRFTKIKKMSIYPWSIAFFPHKSAFTNKSSEKAKLCCSK